MSQLQNEELHNQCKLFCEKSIELIKLSLGNFQNMGFLEKMIFMAQNDKIFSKIQEYENAIKLMKEDEVISKQLGVLVGTYRGKGKMEAHQLLNNLIQQSIEDYLENRKFVEKLFDESYYQLESFFYNDKIPISHKLLIGNFKSENTIVVEDDIIIRPMTVNEKDFFKITGMMGIMNKYSYLTHVLEHVVNVQKLIGDQEPSEKREPNTEFDILEKLLSALRLFKKGKIIAGVFMTQSTSNIPVMGTSWYERGLVSSYSSSEYILKSEELSEFRDLWKLVLESKYHQSKSVSIAIRRFNYAYDREKNEDEIIDYLISFEALFFKNEKQELREKLSRRVARLLENDFDNRKRLSKTIKDFYDKRSSIVHGDETEISPEYVNEIQDVLRKSIKKILEKILTQHHDEIIDHLDFD